jgi:hypothetical protein
MITEAEFEAGKTESGGLTRAQLKKWGVSWPPRKGWKKRLIYPRSELPKIHKLDQPAWHYAVSDAERDRLAMKKLYQEKSGDYSY